MEKPKRKSQQRQVNAPEQQRRERGVKIKRTTPMDGVICINDFKQLKRYE